MINQEDIKLIVEQVLAEINNKGNELNKTKINEENQSCLKGNSPLDIDEIDLDEYLPDISTVNIQEHLQVPEPVNRDFYTEMKLSTPARIGVWRAGTRPLTETLLRFRADHAAAQDSVQNDVSEEFIEKLKLLKLQSACQDKDEFLTRPDLGRTLNSESIAKLRKLGESGKQLQIIIADGLSSTAVQTNVYDLLLALRQSLVKEQINVGTPIFVKYARVAVMDIIGEELKPEAIIMLIGERPGLGSAESLSAYLAYNPRLGMLESERTVISNIHKGGTPPVEAGAHLADVIKQILISKCSGVKLSLK